MDPIKVGIIGFGRSGCNIHADAIARMPELFEVCAICDLLPERRTHEAFPHAKPYADHRELLADPAVELVVVAPPNCYHASFAVEALNAGKHVLCEKPFGFTTADVDAMIAASKRANRILQPFQQRRYEEDFRKVLEICRSGRLGAIDFIRISWVGFSRRWDWQTSRRFGGGQLYNNMPHLVDHALELFGETVPAVWCTINNALSSGDAEDEVHLILHAPGAPTVEVEMAATAAYPLDRWYVCGTAGGLRGNATHLEWKWVDWSKMPERPLDLHPTAGRSYNSETLEWHNDSWDAEQQSDAGAGAAPAPKPVMALYSGLYRAIRQGAPQEITPEQVRRRVAVLEQCYRMNQIPFPKGTR